MNFASFFAEPEIGMPEHQAQAYFRQLISAVVSDEIIKNFFFEWSDSPNFYIVKLT